MNKASCRYPLDNSQSKFDKNGGVLSITIKKKELKIRRGGVREAKIIKILAEIGAREAKKFTRLYIAYSKLLGENFV